MKINKIFTVLSFVFLFASCIPTTSPSSPIKDNDSGQISGSQNNNSTNDNNNSSGGNNTSPATSKIMYFEFKFDGESSDSWTYINASKDKGIRDVLFQIDGTRDTYIFRAEMNMLGYTFNDMFTKNHGREYDIPFYIGNEILKKEYSSTASSVSFMPKISFGMSLSWSSDTLLGVSASSVYKTPFVAPLKYFDEALHTNVAMFNVHHYSYYSELHGMNMTDYKITFVGFKKK